MTHEDFNNCLPGFKDYRAGHCYEVISDVKTISSFSPIPVIILTTAPVTPYAERCKKLGACAYYTKPDTFPEYRDFAKKLYNDVSACINKDNLKFSSVNKQDTILTKRVMH